MARTLLADSWLLFNDALEALLTGEDEHEMAGLTSSQSGGSSPLARLSPRKHGVLAPLSRGWDHAPSARSYSCTSAGTKSVELLPMETLRTREVGC